jgi:hypothetical protein
MAPLPPKPWSGRGRPPTRLRRSPEHQPVSVKELALSLPRQAWRTVTWREGNRTALASRFAARRIRPAHRDIRRSEPWPEEWLLMEWPEGAEEPLRRPEAPVTIPFRLRPRHRPPRPQGVAAPGELGLVSAALRLRRSQPTVPDRHGLW